MPITVLRLSWIVLVLALAGPACQPPAPPAGTPPDTVSPAASGTDITVVGDKVNRYPRVHVTQIQCAQLGAPGASISFVLPAPPPSSTVQGELLINITGTRATALNALDTLFVGPSSTILARTGTLGPLQLQSTEARVHGGDSLAPTGSPPSSGTLTVSGTYACP